MSKINVVGASCVDVLVSKGNNEKVSLCCGGDALNEAFVLAHFKDDVKLVSLLGKDQAGELIISQLNKRNIAFNYSIFSNDTSTYISLVMIDEKGERSFIRSKSGSLRDFDLEDIIIDADCQIVSFGSLFISYQLDDRKYTRLFKSLKEKGIMLCVDSSVPKNNEKARQLECLKYIDYFFCNETEAEALCDSDDIRECYAVLKECGIKDPIIKCGSHGCYSKDRFYPPLETEVIDTTGAGDSFVAGFVHELAKGSDHDQRLNTALYCGSRACSFIGASAWLDYE